MGQGRHILRSISDPVYTPGREGREGEGKTGGKEKEEGGTCSIASIGPYREDRRPWGQNGVSHMTDVGAGHIGFPSFSYR